MAQQVPISSLIGANLNSSDSSALFALAHANALIERPEHGGEVKAGTDVPCILFQNG